MPGRPAFVLDSGPLIALSKSGAFDTVLRVRGTFLIARAVQEEVVEGGRRVGAPEVAASERHLERGLPRVVPVRDARLLRRIEENPRLSDADAESICLALQEDGRLVADERNLRSVAMSMGVPVGGSLFLLTRVVREGLMKAAEAVAAAHQMSKAGWYGSPSLLKLFED